MACKSPTHKAYSDALEGFYIQAHLANRDLTDALGRARTVDPSKPWLTLIHDSRLDTAAERLAFGKSELEEAQRRVNRHFDRGCSNLARTA